MITNFALSLSFQGIEMLHRVQHGWKRVGTADVEADDLDAQLADLRQKAEALAPDGLRTKLLIPLDQIKYIAIDSTQTTQADIDAELDGATPYALSELVVDCERFGGRTHVAAVARETLTEAEAFASAHGFNPVCFAAIPEPFTFQKEVFFGPTSMMTDILGFGAEVERDVLPVMVVGTRIKSRLLVFDLPEDALPPADDFDLAAALAPHVTGETPPEAVAAAPVPEPVDAPVAEAETPAPETADGPEVAPVEFAPGLFEDADLPQDTPDEDPEPDLPVPEVDDAPDIAAEPEPPKPEVAAEPEPPVIPEPVIQPAVLHQPALFDQIVSEYHPPIIDEAPVVAKVAPEVIATEDAGPELAADLPQDAPAISVIPENPVLFVPPLMDLVIPEVRKPNKQRARARKRKNLSTLAPRVPVSVPQLGPPAARVNRPPAPVANTNRRPALIAGTVAAGLVLIGAIAWSALRDTGDGVTTAPVPEVAPDVTEVPTLPAPATVEIVAAPPVVPQIDITGFSVTPDIAAGTVALAIPAEPAAPQPSLPETVAVAALPDALPAPVQPAPAPAVAEPIPEEEPPAEERAVAEAGAPVLRGTVLSPADAERIYAATGVWQRSPRIVDVPSETSTDGMIVPFSETVPGRVEQPQVPPNTALDTDLSFLAPADPPPAEVRFPVDENGFILATPQGTLTPEGAVVFAGAPDVTIRLRPELTPADIERMALLAPAREGVVIVAGSPPVTPPLRPVDAALPTPDDPAADTIAQELAAPEDPTPGAVSLAGLDAPASDLVSTDDPDLRPTARPSSLAGTADPGTPDITAIIAGIAEEEQAAIVNATPQAVVASLRPALRPQNFDRVVAAARARIAAQPAPTPAAPAPAAAPVQTAAPVAPQNYAPVPGGVARAATQEDVLPLREINLIGVYGRPNARRALVRLSNGRYVRVEVGSTLDGGQVTAIGEDALNYVKRGRTLALQLPSG